MGRASYRDRSAGYSLAEVAIALAIVGVVLALAAPSLNRASVNRELRDSVSGLDGGFRNARGEAIRTGDIHLFFFNVDAEGNALVDQNGDATTALIVNDGAPGSPNQNCKIDAGEAVYGVGSAQKVVLSTPPTGQTATGDLGGGLITTGSTFLDPAGNDVTWVMFRPEGMPMSFDANCNLGAPGSGAGGFYTKNATRSFAVLVRPMGTTKVMEYVTTTGMWE